MAAETKTILVTLNATTAQAVAAKIADATPDSFAGLAGNTARTIVRNVPIDIEGAAIVRQLDQLSSDSLGKDFDEPKYVVEYTDLPQHDGMVGGP